MAISLGNRPLQLAMNFLVELDFDPLSFRKLLHVNARKFERNSSQEYYHKTSFGKTKRTS